MAAKKRKTTTDATKHKLPLPKGHPQQRPKRKRPAGSAPKLSPKVAALRQAFEEHRASTGAPLTATDIQAIRDKAKAEYESRAIPCGEDLLPDVPWTRESVTLEGWIGYGPANPCPNVDCNVCRPPTEPVPVPCGEDRFPMGELDPRLTAMTLAQRKQVERHQRIRQAIADHLPPPDTSAYPWAGLSDAWTAFRFWLAVRLTRLAGWVTP